MTEKRDELVKRIWRGIDPFDGFPASDFPADHQGWGAQHSYFKDAISLLRPAIVIEIGVWKGSSSIAMAKMLKEANINSVCIAIDTWLGAWDHWTGQWFESLRVLHGYPTLQKTFMKNVIDQNVEDYVMPLPLDSINASVVLDKFKIKADLIHIDAGHDYEAVAGDIKAWWPLLKPGGILIGDDYRTDGGWPGVRQAFDEFVAQNTLELKHKPTKCWIQKPIDV